jgi:hypothetical protein
MAIFADATGRKWAVDINVPSMKRVKESTGKHLGKLLENECALLHEITSDAILFSDVLRAICAKQITEQRMADDDFDALLGGDVAEKAVEAFWEAVVDFSPSRIRQALRTLATKGDELRTTAANRLTELLPKIANTNAGEILDAICTPTASGSLGSSVFIPKS